MARHWEFREYDYFPPPSRPRAVKGGIKAQSKRGTFGESWWAKRWIAVLESFDIGSRLGRGRSYARSGQVLSIDIDKGLVKAKVQGSSPTPYNVTIKLNALSTAKCSNLWGRTRSICHTDISGIPGALRLVQPRCPSNGICPAPRPLSRMCAGTVSRRQTSITRS